MKELTDLEGIKRIACEWVRHTIITTEMSPMVVMHPFTNTGFLSIRKEHNKSVSVNILEDVEALNIWQNHLINIINQAKEVRDIIILINKPYRLMFIDEVSNFLTKKEYSQELAWAFVGTEHPDTDPGMNKRKLVELFKRADRTIMMREEENKVYDSLDEVVTVYRGVSASNKKNVKALSWTLDLNTAKWFANRNGEGEIYKAQIEKCHTFAFFNAREESEVVLDPKYLVNLEKCEFQEENEIISESI